MVPLPSCTGSWNRWTRSSLAGRFLLCALAFGLLGPGARRVAAQQGASWNCAESWDCPDLFPDSPAPPATSASPDSSGTSPSSPVHPNVGRALGGVAVANLIAVGINSLGRDLESTSPTSWWRNVRGGWNWDNNNISTNNIEHPYGGSVYFNLGRVNGLSFWGSAPVTLAGSLMWELFGEPNPPATNDLITTTVGGIALGETVLRLSDMLLDNETSGLNRFWREAAVVILNPGLGLTRVARGEAWRRGPNPSGQRPDSYRTLLAMGGQHIGLPEGTRNVDPRQAFAAFGLEYGDPFGPAKVAPFSTFTFASELSTGSVTLTRLSTRGMLTAFGRRTGDVDRVSGIFMDLEFRWNEAYMFGQQSFGVGTLSRSGTADGWRVRTDVSAEVAPLVASADQYADRVVDREYDYGAGVGARAAAQVEYRGARLVSAGYRGYLTATLNGASESKLIQFMTVEARAPTPLGISIGAAWTAYWQRSTYVGREPVIQSLPSWSLFVSTGS